MGFEFKAIGEVHSPFKKKEDIARDRCTRPDGFVDIRGQIEIYPEFSSGLLDVDGFSHLFILFVFHDAMAAKLRVNPPLGDKERGVFSSRSPHRPNALGLTVVRLIGVADNVLDISDIDMIEGTPVLDIKPYTPRDLKLDTRWGWLTPFCE
ncbi:tRNA (N6-threonylcarbamoyladenosine(37)-N6)-methyltransferase TrmO [Acidobacteriota bacterium]